MKKTKKAVKQFRKTYGIKGTPTSYELKEIIKKLGFTPYGYHTDEEKLYETKTYDFSTEKPAFTYSKDNKNYVFYNDLLNEIDISRLLAHELGHLYYNHLHRHETLFDTGINKEWEANLFAAYLMEPKELKYYLYRSIVPATLPLLIVLFGMFFPGESEPTTSITEDPIMTTPVSSYVIPGEKFSTSKQTQVYVAAHGTVYHIDLSCSYIKGHSGIREMTLESAKEADLPLCSRCKSKIK